MLASHYASLNQYFWESRVVNLIVIVVGKTSLITRFMYDSFDAAYQATIGIDFLSKTMYLEDRTIRLQLWDTAGQQRYRAITHAYYKGASGSLIVFDLTRRNTFENVSKWIKELRQNAQENMSCILIGTDSNIQAINVTESSKGQ